MEDCEQPVPRQTRESSGVPLEVEVITTNFPSKRFIHRWRMKGGYDWKEGDIEIPHGGDHHIHFEIVDDANLGARFKCTAEEAFGAHVDEGCPEPGSDGDGEIDFKNSNVGGDGTKLFVRDRNLQQVDLNYALFFDAPMGDMKYDPIIKNSGGGIPD